MKVLLLSLLHPEIMRGGAQQLCYELFEGLKEHPDIEPTLLAAIDQNFPAFYKSGARITGFDGRRGEFLLLCRDYDYWWHKTGEPSVIQTYVEFLEMLQPDVVHFHHFLLFGIDFLTLTRRTLPKAKIVFTFHEFLTICAANGQMVRLTDGSLCTHASSVRCHQCFPDRKPEEFFLHEMWMKRHLEAVDVFTTPSKFMIDFFVRWGLDRSKIIHIPNGQKNYNEGGAPFEKREKHNRFGFFGQMVDNKGIHIILQAVQILRSEGFTDFTVEINGDNLKHATEGRRREIEEFFAREQEFPVHERRVFLNGSYHVEQLRQRMARIDWCIVPSVWWEIFGLVISEAWMFGKPVIASNVGGPAERIRDGVDGLLFEMGDPRSLATVMRRASGEALWDDITSRLPEPPIRSKMSADFVTIYKGGKSQLW